MGDKYMLKERWNYFEDFCAALNREFQRQNLGPKDFKVNNQHFPKSYHVGRLYHKYLGYKNGPGNEWKKLSQIDYQHFNNIGRWARDQDIFDLALDASAGYTKSELTDFFGQFDGGTKNGEPIKAPQKSADAPEKPKSET